MSVRKRKWKTSRGEPREAWIVDYVDQNGGRHIETFERKKDADSFHASVTVDVSKGIHTPKSKSITVAQAAEDWLAFVRREQRETSTLRQYENHVRHINKYAGRLTLAKLTMPAVEKIRDRLLEDLSRPMARKVLVSFKSIIREARRRGNIAHNVADGVKITISKRDKKKLQIGVDIPTTDEIARMMRSVQGRSRAFLAAAAFSGLRASELRGLRWSDINWTGSAIGVSQKVDAWGEIGATKSSSSNRSVPVWSHLLQILKEWRLEAGMPADDALVFADQDGKPEPYDVQRKVFDDAQIAASIVAPAVDRHGEPVTGRDGKQLSGPKYSGLHALRHYFASLCINRKEDGGLGLDPKDVQERMGHSTIVLTYDVYGHLFPRKSDGSEFTALEKAILG